MKSLHSLPMRNLRRKPARTCALLVLVGFLAFSLFSGSIVVLSLQRGLTSLEARLGADIIVVPTSAKSKVNLDTMLLNGTTGYFYMDRGILQKVSETEGVEIASPQLFLSSLRADCCSVSVQVIGIDQETDFTIMPWIAEGDWKVLADKEVLVGSRLEIQIGENLRVYGENCRVVGRLDSTGTGLDTAVYTSMNTVRLLMAAADEQGRNLELTKGPDDVISAVYVKVKDGYGVTDVTNDLKLHIRKVEVVETKSMLTGVSDSLAGIASTAVALMALIWLLAFAILLAAFCLLVNERKREFAVLRMVGASRRVLSRMVLTEAVCLSGLGGILGIALGALVVFPFSDLIEIKLGLPFLLPSFGVVLLIGCIALLIIVLAGLAASGYAAFRLSKVETGTVLREGN